MHRCFLWCKLTLIMWILIIKFCVISILILWLLFTSCMHAYKNRVFCAFGHRWFGLVCMSTFSECTGKSGYLYNSISVEFAHFGGWVRILNGHDSVYCKLIVNPCGIRTPNATWYGGKGGTVVHGYQQRVAKEVHIEILQWRRTR